MAREYTYIGAEHIALLFPFASVAMVVVVGCGLQFY